ncbi:YrhB domain-containing protein [Nocardia sp. NBC_01327]|uniref:YrhB domain-containing protein n=1 Tax=Nocardia sp. NBC_01327 TaxID=2903593 RepID=UPI003FA3B565
MDEPTARALASQYLESLSSRSRPLALYSTVEDHGWCYLFGWNTLRYIETGDIADAIGPGTGPIVVVKPTADAWMLSSAPTFDLQLARYSEEHGITPVPHTPR